VTVRASTTDAREKIVQNTPRAVDYLAAHRKAARAIERQLRTEIGADAVDSLHELLDALGGHEQPRMSDDPPQASNAFRSPSARPRLLAPAIASASRCD
jgi:hypothetical protein